MLAATAVALAQRSSGTASRTPLSPQARPLEVPLTGNLLLNPDFELDEMGTTFTAWVIGTPLANDREGIPPTL